jgi:hypothetical protein
MFTFRTLLLVPLLMSGGCSSQPRPLNDDEKIVRAVLMLTASTKEPVCIDDETSEHPLATFREMALAPRASRVELRWYPPTALKPDPENVLQTRSAQAEGANDIRFDEAPVRLDFLPGLQQMMLNGAALRLSSSLSAKSPEVAIRSSWLPANVKSRWWPINRVRKDCAPRFAISNPIRQAKIAFITVQANHWGALYALKPVAGDWVPIAEWSRWLY